MRAYERLLNYVKVYTTSDPVSDTHPTTARQFDLARMLVKELQDHVKRITAPYKYPRVIEFVESLPKTISGKIRRKEIRSDDAAKKSAN